MAHDKKCDDVFDATETASTCFTPPTCADDATIVDGLWDGHVRAVPWPGNTYKIFEVGTGRALCLGDHKNLYLSSDPNANNRWMIVERQGYFGFQNPNTGRYIGHNQRVIHAAVKHMSDWESFVPRMHPDGGYHLLSPVYQHTMKVVSVAANGKGVERRQHSETRFEFVEA